MNASWSHSSPCPRSAFPQSALPPERPRCRLRTDPQSSPPEIGLWLLLRRQLGRYSEPLGQRRCRRSSKSYHRLRPLLQPQGQPGTGSDWASDQAASGPHLGLENHFPPRSSPPERETRRVVLTWNKKTLMNVETVWTKHAGPHN